MISEKSSMEKTSSHIALSIVLGAFHGRLPEDGFAKAVDLHVKCSASDALPRRPAISANIHDVEDMAHVLKEPTREGMLRRDSLTQPFL